MKFRRVIFIDEENTRLGPFAAALLRKKLAAKGSDIRSISRGTVVLFSEPANQKVAEAARHFGVNLDHHRAAGLTEQDFTGDTLLLALDNNSKRQAFETCSGVASIFTLKEYVGENGDIRLPIGEPVSKYETVCETIDRLLELLTEKLTEESDL